MIHSMFVGNSGVKAGQTAMSAIANNIANAQTKGYKSQTARFEELYYQQKKTASAPGENYAGTNGMDVGNGVKVATFATDFTQASIDYTGRKTDLAMEGDGFFIVGNSDGENNQYTRAGNFDVSVNNELVNTNGQYVLGWNMDPMTGRINTGAQLQPIKIGLGEVSEPVQSTYATIAGNLDAESEVGSVYGFQIPTYDSLGSRHDVDYNFVKVTDNSYRYVAVPTDQFRPSAGITDAVLEVSSGNANQLMKGDYSITTAAAGAGQVSITVTDPTGATVLTKTVNDNDQTITLDDGTNNWFSIQMKGGQAPGTATFTVGEAGDMTFDAMGQLTNVTGSGLNGAPMISYTPPATGTPVEVTINIESFTSLAADNGVKTKDTDGMGASTMTSFVLTDGGKVEGYYSDGTIKTIGQIATATFSNPSGLTRVGTNYIASNNSGEPDIGVPDTGTRGQIKAQALEASNVDISTELVNMMMNQRYFTSNTKVITTSDRILEDVLNLGR